jgi:hypothetical protein
MTTRATEPVPLWEQQARHWARVKPPLRPSGEEIRRAQQEVDRWLARGGRSTSGLILGVTPELVALKWPEGCRVMAADLSLPMIRGVFAGPGPGGARPSALLADWSALPLADRSVGLVLGDGCFVLVGREAGRLVAAGVRRILEVEGSFLIRVFVRPGTVERPGAVRDDLLAARFGNFHVFKFRLLMSLVDGAGNVRVAEAYEFFRERCGDPGELARRLGWPVEEVRTIEAYRDQRAVYWFPTPDEFLETVGGEFGLEETLTPRYEMGDRCPIFVFRPRGDRR